MNRKRLAVAIGLSILFVVAALMLWPDNEADKTAERRVRRSSFPKALSCLAPNKLKRPR